MSTGAAPEGGVSPADGSGSRLSKNHRQEGSEGYERPDFLEPSDLPDGAGLRPVSVEPGATLREEATHDLTEGVQARQWYRVVNEWREWYADYRSMHIEYEGPEGETCRTALENSYMPEYGKRYYGKLKDLERGIERTYESLTTVMLTFSASSLNAKGLPRCPADHMREVAEGWGTARKQLHQVLSGTNWEYAKVWEPHEGGERSPGGYGHLHVAVFVEAESLEGERFRPVMESYVRNTEPAGREAHTVENAVSVNDNVRNLGTYISEYIGVFGEDALKRPIHEQMFYATTWATGTRRVDFSNGAHDIMGWAQLNREMHEESGLGLDDAGVSVEEWREFRSERGREMRPHDVRERRAGGSGGCEENRRESGSEGSESGAGTGWDVDSICKVTKGEPEYADPTTGGVEMVTIDGRRGVDPPREVD